MRIEIETICNFVRNGIKNANRKPLPTTITFNLTELDTVVP